MVPSQLSPHSSTLSCQSLSRRPLSLEDQPTPSRPTPHSQAQTSSQSLSLAAVLSTVNYSLTPTSPSSAPKLPLWRLHFPSSRMSSLDLSMDRGLLLLGLNMRRL